MALNTDNLDSGRSPQEELEELLRNARSVTSVKTVRVAPVGAFRGKGFLPKIALGAKVNSMALIVAGLAILLVVGTGYFVISLLRTNTGFVIVESNQAGVTVLIDDHPEGQVSSGSELRLKEGEHILTFTKEGFLENEQGVEVLVNQSQTVVVNLLPVPVVEKVVEGNFQFVRLNKDGEEISYLDMADRTFKTVLIRDKTPVDLFRGSFSNVSHVAWSQASQLAIVQLEGQFSLSNMIDNRNVPGRYVLLGERPSQGPVKNNGIATWLFDDSRKLADAGWQPILLTENIRQIAYSADGTYIAYIYETADGERALVRAYPDGTEWERMIGDLPAFVNPKLTWSADDRYLLIEDSDKLFIADMVSKSFLDVFPDRVPGSKYSISNEGDKLAYMAGDRLRIYDFLGNTAEDIPNLILDSQATFTWLDTNNLVIAMANQTFMKVDVKSGQRVTIPFVGSEVGLDITALMYSRAGQVLMLATQGAIYTMKI